MTTFANQTTNLSALSAALGDFCDRLGHRTSLDLDGGEFRDCGSQATKSFLVLLNQRVCDVEFALMKSTEHILPTVGSGSSFRVTASELSQLLASLHSSHNKKLERVECLVGLSSGVGRRGTFPTDDSMLDVDASKDNPYHWSLGLPLEQVAETDNETDRYSNESHASSVKSLSDRHSPYPYGEVVLAPCTSDAVTSSSTNSDLLHCEQDALLPPFRTAGLEALETAFSGTIEKEAGSEHEDPPSFRESDDDDISDDNDDEVTTLCPTVLGTDSSVAAPPHAPTRKHFCTDESAADGSAEEFFSPRYGQVKLVGVGNQYLFGHLDMHGQRSPSQKVLTSADGSAGAAEVHKLATDVASLGEETPVLDRYRIISDDNSIGFKVLPNERRPQQTVGEAEFHHTRKYGAVHEDIPWSVNLNAKTYAGVKLCPLRKAPVPFCCVGGRKSQFDGSDDAVSTNKENHLILRMAPNMEACTACKTSLTRDITFSSVEVSTTSIQKTSFPAVSEDRAQQKKATTAIQCCTADFVYGGMAPSKKACRRTPRREASDKLNFGSGIDFQCTTPARKERNVFSRVPQTPLGVSCEQEPCEGKRTPAGRVACHSAVTHVQRGVAARKSPYRGQMGSSPPRTLSFMASENHSCTKSDLIEVCPSYGVRMISSLDGLSEVHGHGTMSPVSLSSTISGLTGVTDEHYESQRELQEKADLHASGWTCQMPEPNETSMAQWMPSSMPSSIRKITREEFDAASPLVKLQYTLEETNCAINALNGAMFLRRESGDLKHNFSNTELYKILRNCGFRRRRCKGLVMSLCHWHRLTVCQSNEDHDPRHCFEIVS